MARKAIHATERFKRGTQIQIVSGPYAGHRAVFIEPAKHGRVLVCIDFGRIQTRLALEPD